MTKTIYTFILLLIVACQSREKQQQEKSEYQYVVKSYYSNANDLENLNAVKYYDSSDSLLQEIGKEGDCIRYMYDETGKLMEKVWGRNCEQTQVVVRHLLIYDSLNNHVGTYTTQDKLFDLDTIHYEQIYFYDSENRLVKAKVSEKVEPSGNTIKMWSYYTYDGNKKDSMVIKENDVLLWRGTYNYDKNSRLVELRKVRKNTYETESYIYDNKGRIIEKHTKTNENITTPIGIVKVPNTRRVYTYNSTGFLNKEILYHDDKAIVQEIYIKEYKNKIL